LVPINLTKKGDASFFVAVLKSGQKEGGVGREITTQKYPKK
jgi:hypothetical protein